MTASGNQIRREDNAQLRAEGWLTSDSGDVNLYGPAGDWVAGGFRTVDEAGAFLRRAGAQVAMRHEQRQATRRRYARG